MTRLMNVQGADEALMVSDPQTVPPKSSITKYKELKACPINQWVSLDGRVFWCVECRATESKLMLVEPRMIQYLVSLGFEGKVSLKEYIKDNLVAFKLFGSSLRLHSALVDKIRLVRDTLENSRLKCEMGTSFKWSPMHVQHDEDEDLPIAGLHAFGLAFDTTDTDPSDDVMDFLDDVGLECYVCFSDGLHWEYDLS